MSFTFFPFDGQQRMGASAVFAVALLSTISLTAVLVRVVWIVCRATFQGNPNTSRDGLFFKSQLGGFAGSLLIANLFTAISGLLEINWVALDGVEEGSTCNTQGVLGQIGELATAYFVVVLGIHAFITLALRAQHPPRFVITSVVVGWVGSILIAASPVTVDSDQLGPLYGFVTISCDITRAYPVAHVLVFFVPLFLASLSSTIIYSMIFLVLRGNITVNGGFKLHMHPRAPAWRSADSNVERYRRFVRSVARSIIWFPAAFMLCIVPNAIIQLIDTSGYPSSPPATAFTLVLRQLNGVLDVLVLFHVLQVLSPAFESHASSSEKAFAMDTSPPVSCARYGRSEINSSSERKPYQTHKQGGLSDSTITSMTQLLPSGLNMPSYGDCELARSPNDRANIGDQMRRKSVSEQGHSRAIAKNMISRPMLVDFDSVVESAAEGHQSSQGQQAVAVQPAQHSARRVNTPSDLHQDALSSEPVRTMNKPLPLLPEPGFTPPPRLDSSLNSLVSGVKKSSSERQTTNVPHPDARSAGDKRFSRVVMSKHSVLVRDNNRLQAMQQLIQREVVAQPVLATQSQAELNADVISLYLASRRSTHEDMLPDFPITASEYPTEPRSPARPVSSEPRDFVHPAPPPRTVQRSPSPPGPLIRPTATVTSPYESGESAEPPNLPSIQESTPETAAVTEFDVNEYLASPLPPVPVVPEAFRMLSSDKARATVVDEQPLEDDVAEYYADEVPGLPPLPTFRPRLTVYDDERSIYSASTNGWGFGTRPRESSLLPVRALPLPPHMRLDVAVSPVAFSVPTPNVVVPVRRGFRPIA